jgi:cytochrome oxidase Cu insertion factor (SCO1/SenC/PrrC family)
MTRPQKVLTFVLWSLLVVAVGALAAVWSLHRSKPKLDKFFEVPQFSLLDQDGKPFTNETVAGKVWLADYVFTRCAGPCPTMTAKLAALAQSIQHHDVRFVSFSVDPEYDTPTVLKEYAGRFGADHSRWTFVTGDKPQIFRLATEGMKIAALPADANNVIIHSEKFVLIDRAGWIRGYYDLRDSEAMKKLPDDIRALAAE